MGLVLETYRDPKICRFARKLGFDKCEVIASGKNGTAYDIGDNKVLKMTTAAYEFYSVQKHILGKDIKGLVKYHKAYRDPVIGFVLIMDKVEVLNEEDRKLLDLVRAILFKDFRSGDFEFKLKEMMGAIHNSMVPHDAIHHSSLWRLVVYNLRRVDLWGKKSESEIKRAMKLFVLYVKASQSLISQGINHHDPNSGNVGWDPYGNFVFFDYMNM